MTDTNSQNINRLNYLSENDNDEKLATNSGDNKKQLSEEAPETIRQQFTKNRANYKKWFSKENPEKRKERLAKKTASGKRQLSEQ